MIVQKVDGHCACTPVAILAMLAVLKTLAQHTLGAMPFLFYEGTLKQGGIQQISRCSEHGCQQMLPEPLKDCETRGLVVR